MSPHWPGHARFYRTILANPPINHWISSLELIHVLRQTNERFIEVLDHMRTGIKTINDAELLLSRLIDSLDENEKEKFLKHSCIWYQPGKLPLESLMITFRMIFMHPLQKSLQNSLPFALLEVQYPKQNAFCKDAKVANAAQELFGRTGFDEWCSGNCP